MKKYISINKFENEKYRIQKEKDNFNDKFEIIEDDDILYIKRLDKNGGWGANLILNIFDKIENKEYKKNIGNSNENNIEIKLEKKISKNHYENNFFKLYSISDYNDLFYINYDSIYKNLLVKRLDTNTGWDQKLIIEYYEKITGNIKHINFGPSKENEKNIIIDINKIDYIKIPNIYKDLKIKIEKVYNEYDDKFIFSFDHKTFILTVNREDSNEGWGQNLIVDIEYNEKNYNIYIGPSKNNIMFKKINLKDYKIYIGLTTIPSRINILMNNLKHFIKNQNYDYEKILITIPKNYRRFKNTIDEKSIELLKANKRIEIIYIENDYGPASKYLGPLINDYIKNDDLLIIIDDDRIYNKNLIKNFVTAYRSFPEYSFFSGLWSYFFDKNYKYLNNNFLEISIYQEKNLDNFKFGTGLGGFFGFGLNIKNKKEFIDYNFKIMELINKSFYHDEGIILGYLKKKQETIIYLKHVGCEQYKEEPVDALCKSGLCNRSLIEKEILYITNYQSLL